MHLPYINRRIFLKATSAGVAVLAGPQFLLTGWATARSPDAVVNGTRYDDAQLKALAQKAVDAARAAGAQFADVRIVITRVFLLSVSSRGIAAPTLANSATIGVRAVAGSTIGFASDVLKLDGDKIVALARLAVARSKAGQPRKARAFEFAPAPMVANGSWQTPIEIDPFTIPIGEQEAFILKAFEECKKVKAAGDVRVNLDVEWVRSDEIFASSEGSYIKQRFYRALLTAGAAMRSSSDESFWVSQEVKTLHGGGRGYEALSKANLVAEWPRAVEEVVRLDSLPTKSVDVGQYDLVLSTSATAELVGATIGHPLELDRALLLAVNTKGTSYASPPADVLDKFKVGSPLVNVAADRSRSEGYATVGWDSEGVKPDEFNLVKNGIVVDYLTTRETAPALTASYESQGRLVRSHGCAGGFGREAPRMGFPNLTLRPGTAPATAEELIHSVKHGFYLDRVMTSVDQSGLNVQAMGARAWEIANGRKTGLAKDMAIQFSTPRFWQSVDAIGGAASVTLEHVATADGPGASVSAVPIRVRKVNVVNTGKRA
jgi:TldD protein